MLYIIYILVHIYTLLYTKPGQSTHYGRYRLIIYIYMYIACIYNKESYVTKSTFLSFISESGFNPLVPGFNP